MTEKITISIVSHGHYYLIIKLVNQLVLFHEVSHIILTLNTPQDKEYLKEFKHKKLKIINNKKSLGFGLNHNNAFIFCKTKYFCILNPDIIFIDNPFSSLQKILKNNKNSIVAPCLIAKDGGTQISSRPFPSMFNLLLDYFFKRKRINVEPYYAYNWLSGAFYLMPKKTFSNLGGFDTSFYLYCEDIDMCLRAKKNSYNLILVDKLKVIHFEQKDSHKKIKYFFYHLRSLAIIYYKMYIKKEY